MESASVACYRLAHRTVRVWFEALLGGPVGLLEAACGEWVLVIACGRPMKVPTEADVAFLGGLMARRRRYPGPRRAELGLGPRRIQPPVERVTECVWRVGNVCVRGAEVLIFPHGHQALYMLLARCGLEDELSNLCSALEVARLPRQTEVRCLTYVGEPARERLSSASFWLEAAATVWPGAELATLVRWQTDSLPSVGEWTIERLVDQMIETETYMGVSKLEAIVVERDDRGRITRCLLAFVRPSAWRRAAGSVLVFAYVGVAVRRARDTF